MDRATGSIAVSEESIESVSFVTGKEYDWLRCSEVQRSGLWAKGHEVVARRSRRTATGLDLVAGSGRPELCRGRRSQACGRLLALLLGVPGLFTATPALLLGALPLFPAAPAQALPTMEYIRALSASNPTNLGVAAGDRRLDLTWTNNAQTHDIKHGVEYKKQGKKSSSWITSPTALDHTATSYSIAGLENGTSYDVRIFAFVIAEDGPTEYHGRKYRGDYVTGSGTTLPATDARLSALTASSSPSAGDAFSSLNIGDFASSTERYMATVENTVKYVKLIPTVNDPDATVKVGKGSSLTTVTSGSESSAIALDVGPNAITVEVTAQDGATKKTYTVTVRRQQSTDARLSALKASSSPSAEGTFSPLDIGTFNSSTERYMATVENTVKYVKLIPTVNDPDATVKVGKGSSLTTVTSGSASSAIALDVGPNAITVEVTAEDGATKKTYTVAVRRQQSTDARLSALTASSSSSAEGTFSPLDIGTFNSSTERYMATVENTVKYVKLIPTVNDPDATVKVGKGSSLTTVTSGSASSAIALDVGPNAITVEVTAEDGATKKTYTVAVRRQQSTDARLSALTASSSSSAEGTFSPLDIGTFNSSTERYMATVENTVKYVKLIPTVNDPDATVKVGKGSSLTTVTSGSASSAIALDVGPNAITVEVTAEDGATKKTYTVAVRRQQSTDARLSALTASSSSSAEGTFSPLDIGTFNSSTERYMATVENTVKYVKLIPTVNDPDATVKVGKGSSLTTVTSGSASSAIALDVGPNAITVEVTAQDGATTTYTVTVTRAVPATTIFPQPGPDILSRFNPMNLVVLSGDQRLNLTWTNPFNINSLNYWIQYKKQDDTNWTTSTNSLDLTATSYNITGLENGMLYDVRIFAFISRPAPRIPNRASFVTGRGTPLAPTTDARLSALTASSSPGASRPFTPLTLSPAFASYTTSYTATVANTVTHVKITPTVRDSVATVKVGKGESLTTISSGAASEAIALDVGTNAVTVEVTAQDGTTMKTYTVTVTRQSTDATLSDLTASSSPGASESFTSLTLSPDFASDTDSYTATVVNTMTHVKITPTANNSAAMVKVGKGESLTKVSSGTASEAIALRVGENAITVEVTAEDGTTKKTYTVTVTRQRSTDATLSGLTARARSITIKTRSDKRPFTLLPLSSTFAADTDSYTAMVASTVTHVKITPTVNNSAAMVKVGKKGESLTTVSSGTASEAIALRVGENAVTVEVTAEDEATKKTYTVTVTRGSTDPTVGVLLDTQLNRYNPTNLNIMADDQRLNLTWINPSNTNGLDHWILYKRQDDTIWTTGGSISSSFGETATSYSITGLESGTVYEVRVVVLAFTGTSLSTGNLRRGNFVTGSGTTLAPKPGSGTEGGFTPMTLGTPVTFASGLTPDLEPSFGSTSVPDQSYTEGVEITPLVLPEATGGNGPLTYALTPSLPDGLTLDLATRRLSGNPISPQDTTRYTWTATDADGDEATLTFTIAIAVDPHRQRVREAARRILVEMARRAMSGALDTIGARFGAVGGSGLSLAGQPVSLESGASVADGVGMAVWNNQSLALGELLGESAFSLRLGAAGNEDRGDVNLEEEGPLWSVWGRGDLASFAGGREEETHYDGWLRSGWLGLDARSGRWVAGLALSHEQGQADYDATMAAGDRPVQGRLETSLTALYPYGRWTLANGLELQGVVGAGWGEARHAPADDPRETGTLSMRMASLGVRKSLPDVAGLALALRADAAVTGMETGNGPDAIHNLSADSWRLRAGLEASRRFSLEGEAFLEPFLEAAARQDGGDGLEGSGVELAGGLRYGAPGVAVELRGRWLAAHSQEGAQEQGISLTARAGPGTDGQGLFFALSPRWGAATGGAQALWREDLPVLSTADAGNSGAVDAQVGYGFALPQGGVLTPFAEVGMAGADSRRLRLGTRYAAAVTGLDMDVELAGERRESGDAAAEHALQLDVDLRF